MALRLAVAALELVAQFLNGHLLGGHPHSASWSVDECWSGAPCPLHEVAGTRGSSDLGVGAQLDGGLVGATRDVVEQGE